MIPIRLTSAWRTCTEKLAQSFRGPDPTYATHADTCVRCTVLDRYVWSTPIRVYNWFRVRVFSKGE